MNIKTIFAILIVSSFLASAIPATADPLDDVTDVVPTEQYFVGFYGYPDFQVGDVAYGAEVVAVNNPLKYIIIETTVWDLLVEDRVLEDEWVRYTQFNDPHDGVLNLVPNDGLYTHAAHWGSKRIGGEAAWDVTLGTTAVKVAHIDSGLVKNHEDIDRYLQGYDFLNGDNDPDDESGCNWHGTHTTGTAGATTNNGVGIAGMSQHTVLPIKAFYYAGAFWGCTSTTQALVDSLQYAGDQGAHLSSNSWGGGGGTAQNDAIQYAHGKGTIHIASAGNSGPCSNCVGEPWKSNPSIVHIVSSLTDGDTFSSFSSEGPEVDVIAPGDYIAGPGDANNYYAMSGTSMAAPHVTGSLALYLAVNPGSTFADTENALASTSEDLGLASNEQGMGLVRADNLVAGGSVDPQCSDGIDNDGDGQTDYPADDGCTDANDNDETDPPAAAQCNDGIDNDGDGLIDYPADPGCTDADDDDETDPAGGSITLNANGYKVKGRHHIDLDWTGASGSNVDVYRDGGVITTTANDGFYTDATGQKGGGSYTHQVCEEGTSTCSNITTTTF